MRSSKVLVVSEIFYPEGGGAEYATYLILKLLAKIGHKITVVTGTKNPAKINGVKYYHTELLGMWNRVKRIVYISMLARQQWFLELLKDHDILYVPLMAYSLIPVAKKYGLKTIVHLHNYVPVRYHGVKYYFEKDSLNISEEIKVSILHEIYANNSIMRALAFPISYAFYKISRNWFKDVDEIICVSRRQSEIIARSMPNIAKNIKIIYNPLPEVSNIEKRPDEKPTFLYAGGGSNIKGYRILIWILKTLGKRGRTKAKFILTNTYNSQQIKELVMLRNKSKIDIEILGRINYETLLKVYSRAWALLFLSIWEEPLPYTILEAFLMGTLPISFDLGGIREIVLDSIAEKFLCKPIDINCIIEHINNISSLSKDEIVEFSNKLKNEANKKLLNIEDDMLKILKNTFI